MNGPFSEMLSKLTSEAVKVSNKLKDSEKVSGTPVILHPQVWKNKEDAIKAQEDPEFREKSEILKKFERQMSL